MVHQQIYQYHKSLIYKKTLDGKQNIITDNSLSIARTSGLQTALNDRYTKTAVDTLLSSKQDLTTTTNPLSISQIKVLKNIIH